MATARPFAYNTGSPISGTEQIGNLAIGFPTSGFVSTGLEWWNGPDEELGYVIAQDVPDDSQPTPVPGITGASVGFFRSEFLTEASFIEIAEVIAGPSGGGPFSTGSDAKTWLNENGYWTSYSSPVTSGLVLYYDPSNPSSYSGSGTTLNDLSDSGLNGTMSNILFSDPYFEYNGSSSQVSVPDSPLLEPGSGSWTMEVWFYADSFSSSSVILGKFDDGGLSQDVSYSIRVNTAGNLFAQYSNGSPSSFVNSTSYSLNSGETYQAVYVWTNSGSTKTLETFINGVSIGSVNHSFNSIVNSTNPLYLGSYNGGEYQQWLNGGIGITRLYNKSLSSSEVLQNYNADKNKYGL